MIRTLVVFGVALVFWLIVTLPLKLVLTSMGGLASQSDIDAYGTIWEGQIYDAPLGRLTINEVRISTRPYGLLTGLLDMDWQISDTLINGRGKLERNFVGDVRVTATDLIFNLDQFDLSFWPGLDNSERVFVSIDALHFNNNTCLEARGLVRTDVLSGLPDLGAPVLEGELGCRDGLLVIDFTGLNDALTVFGDIRFDQAGYDWSVDIHPGSGPWAEAESLVFLQRNGENWQGRGRVEYEN